MVSLSLRKARTLNLTHTGNAVGVIPKTNSVSVAPHNFHCFCSTCKYDFHYHSHRNEMVLHICKLVVIWVLFANFAFFHAIFRYLPRGEDSFRTLTKMCKIYLLQVSQLIWVTRRLVPKIISNVFFVFISCDYIYSDDRFCQTNMPCKGSLPGKRGFFGGLCCREFGLVNL